jgi:hypothetical protein
VIETRDGRYITVEPMDWVVEEDGKIKAQITQIPLRLAWAITIHKSQGMSLDAALMDLSQVFEYGQGYVALSRVRSLDGLHLLGWNPQTFMVHPEIIEADVDFHRQSEEAGGVFGNIEQTRLQQMHDNFIIAAGGNLEKKERKVKEKKSKKDTLEETKALVLERKSIKDIMKARELTYQTVTGHLEKLVAADRLKRDDIVYLITPALDRALPEIDKAFRHCKTEFLAPVHEYLKGKYSYDTLRLAKVVLMAK